MIQSAGRVGGLQQGLRPRCNLDAGPRQRGLQIVQAVVIGGDRERGAEFPRIPRQLRDVAPAGQRHDLEPLGRARIRSSVFCPIEPVAPKIDIRLGRHPAGTASQPSAKNSAAASAAPIMRVEPVENTAMSGQDVRGVLDPAIAA